MAHILPPLAPRAAPYHLIICPERSINQQTSRPAHALPCSAIHGSQPRSIENGLTAGDSPDHQGDIVVFAWSVPMRRIRGRLACHGDCSELDIVNSRDPKTTGSKMDLPPVNAAVVLEDPKQ